MMIRMRKPSPFVMVLVLAVILLLATPSLALAFEQRSGQSVVVSDDVADDLYVFGTTIDITGDVNGDVIAFGQSLTISGDVSGDVIAAGATVNVRGSVGGSVRAAGQDIEIAGPVGEDVLLAGATLKIIAGSTVGRDAILGGSAVSIGGDVKRNVLASVDTLTIASVVGGDATADVNNLAVTSAGSITGDLTYYSDNQATVSGHVGGQTVRHPARTHQGEGAGAETGPAALVWLRSFVGMALFALLVIVALRGSAVAAADEVGARPLRHLGIGLAVLMLVFPVAGFVFVLGLFIGGWWIAFALIAAVWLLSLVGLVIGAFWAGRLVLRALRSTGAHPALATLLGLLIVWLIGAVPYVGWLAGFVAMLLGLGAVLAKVAPPAAGAGSAPPAMAPAPPVPPTPPLAPAEPPTTSQGEGT